MKSSLIQLDYLPDEVLLNILKKLDNNQVLYSLMNTNERLNNFLHDSTFTSHLSLMDCSSDNSMKPLSITILERFYSQILPKIHHKIQWFNVEMSSMEHNNVLNNLFKKQIISLCISFKRKQRSTDAENRIIFEDIMTVFTNLQYFRLNYSINAPYMSFITSPPTFVSSTLLELHINVENFNDCLYMLDGRFEQLQSLHINTSCIFRTIRLIIDNTESLPNLKSFSLRCDVATSDYQQLIVPLLNRMLNLEKLHLHLIKFTFNIRSDIRLHDQTNLLSNKDIQCTFDDLIDNEIITSVDYFLEIERANNFPGGIFKYVQLTLINEKAQYDKRSSTSNDNNEHLSIIEYPHLTKLDLSEAHHDYIEQFLLDTKTCLPNDVYLVVQFEELKRMTHCFESNTTRTNCDKIRSLALIDVSAIPIYLRKYFPCTKFL
ncbi:hypothetical protein I4U23_014178 [Adineta vaga]|nr:hypothetical protein I4U23_014178 [Adineta vaga]